MTFPGRGASRCCAHGCRPSAALIGFVGGPFTLYAYAVAGSHEGFARDGLPASTMGSTAASTSGCANCWPPTWRCRREAGADCVAIFDTAAGYAGRRRSSRAWRRRRWRRWCSSFERRCPHTPLIYYSRDTGPAHWAALRDIDLQCLGIDWRHDLVEALRAQSDRWSVQGNIDPQWLLLPPAELEARLRACSPPAGSCRRRCVPPGSAGSDTACCSTRRKTTCGWSLEVQREMFA